jgi:hypothetical protein
MLLKPLTQRKMFKTYIYIYIQSLESIILQDYLLQRHTNRVQKNVELTETLSPDTPNERKTYENALDV